MPCSIQLDVETLSVSTSRTSISTSGSGRTSASISGWRDGVIHVDISAGLDDGPGSAAAQLDRQVGLRDRFSQARPVFFDTVIEFGNGIDIPEGVAANANWDLYWRAPAIDVLFGDIDGVFSVRPGTARASDVNVTQVYVEVDSEFRLPIEAEARFEIDLLRTAAPCPNLCR
ncbi:MAG: hypothetical protein R3F54_24825 [Alphaproteobacteria bacterium]